MFRGHCCFRIMWTHDCVSVIYAVCQMWQQTFISFSNFRRTCDGVPAHIADLSLPLSPSIIILPLLCRPTVAPENTFAYTSQLQIHESKNEVSDKIHHTQVGSHTLMRTHTQITCMCAALANDERRVIYADLK